MLSRSLPVTSSERLAQLIGNRQSFFLALLLRGPPAPKHFESSKPASHRFKCRTPRAKSLNCTGLTYSFDSILQNEACLLYPQNDTLLVLMNSQNGLVIRSVSKLVTILGGNGPCDWKTWAVRCSALLETRPLSCQVERFLTTARIVIFILLVLLP